MRLGTFLALALVSVAGPVCAQHHVGDILIGSASPAAIQRIRATTPVTASIVAQSPSANSLIYGVTMDVDNRAVVFTETLDPTNPARTGGVWKVDPATGALLGTIALGSALFESPRQVIVDQNGNYVVASRGQTSPTTYEYRLLEIDRMTGVVSTIAREPSIGQPAEWRGGLIIDVDTGDYMVQDRDPAAPIATQNPLLRITHAGAITTVAYLPTQPRYGLAQDIRSGDFFVSFVQDTLVGNGGLLRVSPSGVINTFFLGSPGGSRHAFTAIVADRATAASPRLVSSYVDHVYHTDTTTAAITSFVAPAFLLKSPRSSTIEGSRTVQTIRTAGKRWDIALDFPGFGGKRYVMGASISGVRPGAQLPDGRRVAINPDPVLVFSYQGLLAPSFNPGPGVLDANGRARGSINLGTGSAPLGIPVWIQVLILDPPAPLGIAVIEDPYVLRV